MSPVWLFLAVFCQLSTYFLNAFILKTLLPKGTVPIAFFTLVKMSLVIIFVNQVLPTGGISGNGYVFNQLVKRKVDGSKAFSVLVMESICYYIAFILFLSVFYGWYRIGNTNSNPVITYTAIAGFIFYSFLALVMVVLSNRHTLSSILNRLGKFPRIQRYIEKVDLPGLAENKEEILKVFFKHQRSSLITIGLQILIITCDVFTVFAILKGFHLDLPFQYIVLGLLLSLVIGALPLSPGSLIAYESAMTYFFTSMGTPVHAALIVTLLFRFLTFWLPIPVGLLLYNNLKIKE